MGHWYTPEGEAKHWIEGANGKMRDTTLRDAKKLGLLPSVTEIIGTIDKPALTNWKLKKVTGACYQFDPEDWYEEGEEAYHSAMLKEAFLESTDQRDRGSEIHNCIEMILKDDDAVNGFDDDIRKIADAALLAIFRHTGTYLHDVDGNTLTPEQIVVGNGYAGMVDAHNDEFIIDWKTKDIEEGKNQAWPEMAMQLAAYNQALWRLDDIGERRCLNVFIDRTTPGLVIIKEWTPEDIETGWEKFKCLLRYWQLTKGYAP